MRMQNQATRVAAAMIAMAAAATTAQAQNLLINGDFEAGAAEQYGAPAWPGGGNVFTTGSYARNDGGKSFKTYAPYSQYAGSVGLQSAAVTPGDTYQLTGYMFSPSNDFIASADDFGLLELAFFNGDTKIGGDIGRRFINTTSADQWNQYIIDAVAPAGATRAQVVIGYIQLSTAPLGAVFFDDISLTKVVAPAESTWISSSSGGWLSAGNWQNGIVPNATDAVANFGSAATEPTTVTIASSGVTAGTVRFNNAISYTIAGPGGLTLDVATGSAALAVQSGSHTINAPLALNDSTIATVVGGQTLTVGAVTINNGSQLSTAGAGTLRVTGPINGGAGASLRANGGLLQVDTNVGPASPAAATISAIADAGELRFNSSANLSGVTIGGTGKITLADTATASVLRTPTLTIASGGTLDVGDNFAIVDYTGTSPAAAIRAAIIEGKNGNFAGTGITSSKAAADARYSIGYAEASALPTLTTFGGQSGYDGTTLLVRSTLRGDADLSGTVNFADLVTLAQNYNGSGKVWSEGDNDYSGTVNFADLVALAQNYNTSVAAIEAAGLGSDFAADYALAVSLVPEPTTLMAAAGAASILLRRRSRV